MKAIFKIISFTRHLWNWYVFMGAFIIFSSLLSLVVPLLSKQIVDLIVSQISGQNIDFSRFIWLLVAIIATDIFISIFTAFSQWIGDILIVRLETFLSKQFYQHILSLHIGYFDEEITGKIVNKMYRGISSITDFIRNMLNNFLPFFFTAFVTIILLSYFSLFTGILLAILFPIYILISHKSTITWEGFEAEKNFLLDRSQGRVFESLLGIRVVKSFAAQIHELTSFIRTKNKIESLTFDQTKNWHVFDFIRRVSLNIILFAIYSYIVYWTFQERFTIGEMTLLIQLTNQAKFPLFAMSFILGQIQRANTGSADFFQVLETKNQIIDKKKARKLAMFKIADRKKPLIEFKSISFSYEKGKKVLKDINFNILKNKKLALVGQSGEGKSTIVNLLLRYYEPQKGQILINEQNVADVTQESLHQNIAVVFQESLLFSGSILENIRYGKPKANIKEVIEAAKAANAHEFIVKLPKKYKSLIGERGVKLSGGQKQRIAIARAILKNAPIIVLDEATSSLDSRSELKVQKGLDRLLANRTSIIIAHRLSTISDADNILVLENGTVSQYGSPSELIKDKQGLYAQLINLQQQLLRVPTDERKRELEKFDLVG